MFEFISVLVCHWNGFKVLKDSVELLGKLVDLFLLVLAFTPLFRKLLNQRIIVFVLNDQLGRSWSLKIFALHLVNKRMNPVNFYEGMLNLGS